MLCVPGVANAQEEQQASIDPMAMELAQKSLSFISSAPAVEVSYFVTYDRVFEGREKITFTRSGTNTLVRGEGFYSYSERRDNVREYYFDGQNFTAAAPQDGFYATAPFEGDFDSLVAELQERFAITLPIWEMMSAAPADDFLAEVERAQYLGTTLIAGHEVHHLAFSEYDEDFQMWVSTDEALPVPLMIVGTNPYSQGWPQYHAFFYDWTTDPEVAEGKFTHEPKDGERKISFASYVDRAQDSAAGPSKD